MSPAGMLLALLSLGLWGGVVSAHEHGGQPKQAMFKTRAEAEAAAAGFGCKGAHPMGEMWMVCEKHGQSEQNGH